MSYPWLPSIRGPALKKRARFVLAHWKLGVHLVCRTKRFGVNNGWWATFDSLWGWSLGRLLWSIVTVVPMIKNLQGIWVRAVVCHFLGDESKMLMYGWKAVSKWRTRRRMKHRTTATSGSGCARSAASRASLASTTG